MAKGGGFLKSFTRVCLPIAKFALIGIAGLNALSGVNLMLGGYWKAALSPIATGAVNLLGAGILDEIEDSMEK